jgi:hypothetical protein
MLLKIKKDNHLGCLDLTQVVPVCFRWLPFNRYNHLQQCGEILRENCEIQTCLG